ncbi:MAG: monofunctional biosynthetic peptidoglycan transglycosylase [Desulfosarcinaceae bacterium]
MAKAKRTRRSVKRRRPLRFLSGALAGLLLLSLLAVVPLRWLNPPTTSFILQDERAGEKWVRRHWTPLEAISPHLPLAVIAAEDQKFPDHHGLDLESIRKALREKRRRPRGASTISQQLAKNLYLWSGRSLVRKGIEAWLTLIMEATWPKDRIMEIYLNTVEFGPGVYGVATASRRFFGRPPKRLNRRQAALLAAVLPSPKRMSARSPSAYVNQRASEIQHWMVQLGGKRYLPW